MTMEMSYIPIHPRQCRSLPPSNPTPGKAPVRSNSSLAIHVRPRLPMQISPHVERELEGIKRRFKNYELRPDSWQERDIAGSPAISFAGDYKEGKDDYVQYRVYMLNELKIEFIFRVAADRFDDFLPAFESIVSSFRME